MPKPNTESKVRDFREAVGKSIRSARAGKRLSQIDVATIAGTSPARISELEAGKADPRLSTLVRIADVLDLSVALVADANTATAGI